MVKTVSTSKILEPFYDLLHLLEDLGVHKWMANEIHKQEEFLVGYYIDSRRV